MTRIMSLVLLSAIWALPALAQGASQGFPLGKAYKAVSISGFDVQKMGLTLAVVSNPSGDGFRGSGHAGCNGWNAAVMLRDDQIDFTNIVTTKKYCGKNIMTAEDAFLASLRSARRWRTDGERLIIEGDAARLLLRAGAADTKAKEKPAKPDKRVKPQQ